MAVNYVLVTRNSAFSGALSFVSDEHSVARYGVKEMFVVYCVFNGFWSCASGVGTYWDIAVCCVWSAF